MLNSEGEEVSFFSIMSKVASYLGSNVVSRCRIKGEKQYYNFIVTAHSNSNLIKITNYFNKYPLLSSKYLDYLSWC